MMSSKVASASWAVQVGKTHDSLVRFSDRRNHLKCVTSEALRTTEIATTASLISQPSKGSKLYLLKHQDTASTIKLASETWKEARLSGRKEVIQCENSE